VTNALHATLRRAKGSWLHAIFEKGKRDSNEGTFFLGFVPTKGEPGLISCLMPIGRRIHIMFFEGIECMQKENRNGSKLGECKILMHSLKPIDIFESDYGQLSVIWGNPKQRKRCLGTDSEMRWIAINNRDIYRECMFAFAMASHHRLGARSRFHGLHVDIFPLIARQFTYTTMDTEDAIRTVGHSCGEYALNHLLEP
jgi:hypothetical protein